MDDLSVHHKDVQMRRAHQDEGRLRLGDHQQRHDTRGAMVHYSAVVHVGDDAERTSAGEGEELNERR